MSDDLGTRMKTYEDVNRSYLTKRLPKVLRIDGRAFHTFTRGMRKPFDQVLADSMWETCKYLCQNIQGCKLAYTQSDEISLLLTDYETIQTDTWFGGNIQKMASISASMTTLAFNNAFRELSNNYQEAYIRKSHFGKDPIEEERVLCLKYFAKRDIAMFDSRVFALPKEEVCNYFIWRQQDATRNSIEACGQANFSQNQLHGLSCNEIQEKLFQEKNLNWNDLSVWQKRGACIVRETYELDNEQKTIRHRWAADMNIPVFTQDRNYIEKFL